MSAFCCAMRQRFIVAIVGVNPSVPEPIELFDYIVKFENENGGSTIGFKFCPWCGKPINHAVDPTYETTPPKVE